MLKKYSGNILTNCFTRTEKREEKTNGKRQKTFFSIWEQKNKKAANRFLMELIGGYIL